MFKHIYVKSGLFKDIYVKSGLMVVKSLTTLQQTWVTGLELITRRT